MFLWIYAFTLSVRLACNLQRHERLLRIRYWFTSNHILFPFGCRSREAIEARGQNPRGRGRGRGQNPRGRGRNHNPRGRGQVFRPRGRGQASRPNIPAIGETGYERQQLLPLGNFGDKVQIRKERKVLRSSSGRESFLSREWTIAYLNEFN